MLIALMLPNKLSKKLFDILVAKIEKCGGKPDVIYFLNGKIIYVGEKRKFNPKANKLFKTTSLSRARETVTKLPKGNL